jgi:hypothetical protein
MSRPRKITAHVLPMSGGRLEARLKDLFLGAYVLEGNIVIPIVEEQPLGAGVIVVNNPVVQWEISVLREEDTVDDRMEYFDAVSCGKERLYLFRKRALR